jgi:hypothetical protein
MGLAATASFKVRKYPPSTTSKDIDPLGSSPQESGGAYLTVSAKMIKTFCKELKGDGC